MEQSYLQIKEREKQEVPTSTLDSILLRAIQITKLLRHVIMSIGSFSIESVGKKKEWLTKRKKNKRINWKQR